MASLPHNVAYRPRRPECTVLYRVLARHFERFMQVYDELRPHPRAADPGCARGCLPLPGLRHLRQRIRPCPLRGVRLRFLRCLLLQAPLHLPVLPCQARAAFQQRTGKGFSASY